MVLEWRTVSGKGLVTNLFRPWIGPLKVLRQISLVNYEIRLLTVKQKFYVVHVEKLNGITKDWTLKNLMCKKFQKLTIAVRAQKRSWSL